MDLVLHKTTSENFHFFNIRLEKLNQENLELKDSTENLQRVNSDLKQQVAKLKQDVDLYKGRFSQSQMTVSNKTLEIKNLKSLQSMTSFCVERPRAISIELLSKDNFKVQEDEPIIESEKEAPIQREEISQSLQFAIPELKKRSVSLNPSESNPVFQLKLSKNSPSQSSNQAGTASQESQVNFSMAEQTRLISEMFKQEVRTNANLKRRLE